jgi:dTDP-4-dehydrorhamnose 3,5-epimerase
VPYTFTPFELPGLLLIEGKLLPDERGHFMEAYRADDFGNAGIPPFVQDNLSRSKKGVLRGMHYQKNPKALGKLIRCVRGKIFDAVVDLRKKSPTYGNWAALELDGDSNKMLWVPPGFAHGFYTLSDGAEVIYKVTGWWAPDCDRGVAWNDPAIGIKWPKGEVIVAKKDAEHPPLAQADNNFEWTGEKR